MQGVLDKWPVFNDVIGRDQLTSFEKIKDKPDQIAYRSLVDATTVLFERPSKCMESLVKINAWLEWRAVPH